jgi:hypothetical protein
VGNTDAWERKEIHARSWYENLKETGHLEDLDVDGRTKEIGRGSVDSSGSRQGAVAGFCERSHKHSGSIKMLVISFH